MKTPEEIKKGLGSCNSDECHGNHTDCPYVESDMCMSFITGDALAYIQQLEAELEAVKRERDAAVKDIPRACGYCKHFLGDEKLPNCNNWDCKNISGINTGWEWRGVQENGGVE